MFDIMLTIQRKRGIYMKKLLKFAIKLLPVVIMIAIVVMPTVMGGNLIDFTNEPDTGNAPITQGIVSNVWGVLKTILQIAAIGALIFSGVRYMFASADAKADIKKSMTILVVGALIVFGSTIFIDIITRVAKDITGSRV